MSVRSLTRPSVLYGTRSDVGTQDGTRGYASGGQLVTTHHRTSTHVDRIAIHPRQAYGYARQAPLLMASPAFPFPAPLREPGSYARGARKTIELGRQHSMTDTPTSEGTVPSMSIIVCMFTRGSSSSSSPGSLGRAQKTNTRPRGTSLSIALGPRTALPTERVLPLRWPAMGCTAVSSFAFRGIAFTMSHGVRVSAFRATGLQRTRLSGFLEAFCMTRRDHF